MIDFAKVVPLEPGERLTHRTTWEQGNREDGARPPRARLDRPAPDSPRAAPRAAPRAPRPPPTRAPCGVARASTRAALGARWPLRCAGFLAGLDALIELWGEPLQALCDRKAMLAAARSPQQKTRMQIGE